MVCEELDSFLSQEERAREEARGRTQEENICERQERQEEQGSQQEREGWCRKCLDLTSSQKALKICITKQSVNSQPWAPDSST